MMNLSTLFFLVNTDSTNDEDGKLLGEIHLMDDLDSEPLFSAPEEAVKKVLGFAASYSTVPSVFMKEIDFYKN